MARPQFRLRLLQPKAHIHLTVHGGGGGQGLLRPCAVADTAVELAEAEVAVRDEGPQAEFVGQGHSLAVAFDRLNVERLLTRRDFCESPECPGLVATLVVLSGEIKSMPREGGCVSHPTCQETCLAEPGDPER